MSVHAQVARAVADGTLTRQPCEVCGDESALAHHDDYAKPLHVRWLCPSDHRRWHAEHKAANLHLVPTTKLVADVRPELAVALAKKAAAQKITKRAAIEQAITDYVEKGRS